MCVFVAVRDPSGTLISIKELGVGDTGCGCIGESPSHAKCCFVRESLSLAPSHPTEFSKLDQLIFFFSVLTGASVQP